MNGLHTHLSIQAVHLLHITPGENAEVLITAVAAVSTMVTHQRVRNLPEATQALKQGWERRQFHQLTGCDVSSTRPARTLLKTGECLVSEVAIRAACAGHLEGHRPLGWRLQRQLCCVVSQAASLLPTVHFTQGYSHGPTFAGVTSQRAAVPFLGPGVMVALWGK